MDKQQIKDLLIQIKVFYPRFESVEKIENKYGVLSHVIDSWYRQIGFMEYEEAIGILDRYMESDQGNKTPTVSIWKRGRKTQSKAWHSTIIDPYKRKVTLTPENGEPQEVSVIFSTSDGLWVDEDSYLYAYPEMDEEHWKEYYGHGCYVKIPVVMFNEDGSPVLNFKGKPRKKWKYVPEQSEEAKRWKAELEELKKKLFPQLIEQLKHGTGK